MMRNTFRFLQLLLGLNCLLPLIADGYVQLGIMCRWPAPDTNPYKSIVVKYYINQNGDPGCIGGDEFQAIQRALQTWSNVTTSRIQYSYYGTTPLVPHWSKYDQDQHNVLGWVQSGWCDIPDTGKLDPLACGVTRVFGDQQGGDIRETDIFINGEYYDWSANPAPSCPGDRVDVEDVVAHESGHALGLGDLYASCDSAKTMYGHEGPTPVCCRTLEPDDIAGASFLYPYPANWFFDELVPLYRIEEHDFNSDIAIAWNPMDGAGNYKSEYIHGACQESQYTSIASESFVPLDSVIWPVCVVYGNNGTPGWSYREHLSAYHHTISGPELEIDKDDKCHIVWTEKDDSMGNVIYRKRENGIWGQSIDLSGTVRNPRFPVIAVQHWPSTTSPHGSNVYVAWLEDRRAQDGSYKPCIMFKRNINGGWLQPELLHGPDNIYYPQLALDSTGGVHLVWVGTMGGPTCIFYAKNTDRGESNKWRPTIWKNVDVLGAPSIAVDGAGLIHIVYTIDLGSSDHRIEYSSIDNLANSAATWDTMFWDLGYISPSNVIAQKPQVVCDNMGFIHFFWSDNRYHAGQYKFDAFYRRNYRNGASANWDTTTQDNEGRPGEKIYLTQLDGCYFLAGVAQPDSFGDVAVVADVWTQIYRDYDVFGNCFRQDDTLRLWPSPFNNPLSSPLAGREMEGPFYAKQGCYISGSVNQLAFFAPTECRLSYFSIDGRFVKEESVKGAGTIKPAGLPSGVYFARIQSGDGTSKQAKVVIVN